MRSPCTRMGAALAIRGDIEAAELRRLARQEQDGRVSARLLALANALDGMSREAAARAAGMDRQTLRDWVVRFNAEGTAGLRDQPRPGRPTRMTEGQQAAFKAIVLRGPDPERDGVSAWRIADLCRIAAERFGVVYREGGMLRLVKAVDRRPTGALPHFWCRKRGARAEIPLQTKGNLDWLAPCSLFAARAARNAEKGAVFQTVAVVLRP